MNRSHHTHYFPANIDPALKLAVVNGCMKAPAFIGQGWSQRLWSDTVGGYVVAIEKTSKGKPLIGLVRAAQEIIDEDKQLFKDNTLENMVDARPDEFVEKPNEIWWLDDGMNGRVYDIIEV